MVTPLVTKTPSNTVNYKIVINENKRTMGYPEFIKTKEHCKCTLYKV